MKYAEVNQSLQEYMLSNWVLTPVDSIQFDNVAFNSELFDEYVQCTIRFGESVKRSLPIGCYRQFGMVLLTLKVRPSTGSNRKLLLAAEAAEMINNVVVHPVSPLVAPAVNLRDSSLYDDSRERDGWVMAQVSSPFYYDWSS